MEDSRFESSLLEDMYSNEAVLHILIEAGEAWAQGQGQPGYTVADLKSFRLSLPTIEHVFSQTPTFGFPSRGFDTEEQYNQQNDKIGNLTVLEKDLNSRCQNKTPEQKLEDANLYKQSRFDITSRLVAEAAANGKGFCMKDVEERTRRMAQFAKARWPLWR